MTVRLVPVSDFTLAPERMNHGEPDREVGA